MIEYKLISLNCHSLVDDEMSINDLAKDGWMLHSVYLDDGYPVAVMFRKKH